MTEDPQARGAEEEIRAYRRLTLIMLVGTALGWFSTSMISIPPVNAFVIGFRLLMVGLFPVLAGILATGWGFSKGYLQGWQDGKKSPSGPPPSLGFRGLFLLRGGKSDRPN